MRVESLAFSGAGWQPGWQPARYPEGAPFTAAAPCKRGSLADCQSTAAYQAAPQRSHTPNCTSQGIAWLIWRYYATKGWTMISARLVHLIESNGDQIIDRVVAQITSATGSPPARNTTWRSVTITWAARENARPRRRAPDLQ